MCCALGMQLRNSAAPVVHCVGARAADYYAQPTTLSQLLAEACCTLRLSHPPGISVTKDG